MATVAGRQRDMAVLSTWLAVAVMSEYSFQSDAGYLLA